MVIPQPWTVCRLRGQVLPEPESAASAIGHITLGEKPTGQPGEGDPRAGLDPAGGGNVAMGAGLRARAKALEELPNLNVRASPRPYRCERSCDRVV